MVKTFSPFNSAPPLSLNFSPSTGLIQNITNDRMYANMRTEMHLVKQLVAWANRLSNAPACEDTSIPETPGEWICTMGTQSTVQRILEDPVAQTQIEISGQSLLTQGYSESDVLARLHEFLKESSWGCAEFPHRAGPTSAPSETNEDLIALEKQARKLAKSCTNLASTLLNGIEIKYLYSRTEAGNPHGYSDKRRGYGRRKARGITLIDLLAAFADDLAEEVRLRKNSPGTGGKKTKHAFAIVMVSCSAKKLLGNNSPALVNAIVAAAAGDVPDASTVARHIRKRRNRP